MRDDLFAPYRAGLGNPGRTPALVARRQAAEAAAQPVAELPPTTVSAPMPANMPADGPSMGSMGGAPTAPQALFPEAPPVGGPDPYARPAPVADAAPTPAPPQGMSADELNRMVLALLQGGGGNSPEEELMRRQMALAPPQQGGIY